MIRKNEGLNCVCLASEPCQAGYNEIQRRKYCLANPKPSTDPLPAIPELINLSIRNAEKRMSREEMLFNDDLEKGIQRKPGNKNDLKHIAKKRSLDHMLLDHMVYLKRKRLIQERPEISKGIVWALFPTLGNELTTQNRITAVLHTQNRIEKRLGR